MAESNYKTAQSLAANSSSTSASAASITFAILSLVEAVNEQTRTLRDLETAVRYQAGLELRKDGARDT